LIACTLAYLVPLTLSRQVTSLHMTARVRAETTKRPKIDLSWQFKTGVTHLIFVAF